MRCILEVLPPDAFVTGAVGDRGSYFRFEAPVREARIAALAAGEKWAANQMEYARKAPEFHGFTFATEKQEPPSVTVAGFGIITLAASKNLNTAAGRSGWGDIRLPWYAQEITLDDLQCFYDSNDDGSAVRGALVRVRKATEMLEQIDACSAYHRAVVTLTISREFGVRARVIGATYTQPFEVLIECLPLPICTLLISAGRSASRANGEWLESYPVYVFANVALDSETEPPTLDWSHWEVAPPPTPKDAP
jgi:hypothetical protein